MSRYGCLYCRWSFTGRAERYGEALHDHLDSQHPQSNVTVVPPAGSDSGRQPAPAGGN